MDDSQLKVLLACDAILKQYYCGTAQTINPHFGERSMLTSLSPDTTDAQQSQNLQLTDLATHGVLDGGLLGGGCCAASARLQVLEDNVVGKYVDRQLLIAKFVETRHLVTRRGTDFVGDLLARREHSDQGRLEFGLCERQPL